MFCVFSGIYDLYVDFPQQKITIIGWADPEKIVKAIKKTRKTAIICSHTEQSDQQAQQTTEQVPEGGSAEGGEGATPPEPNKPPAEQQPAEAAPPPEPQKESPPPPPENPPSDANPPPDSANGPTSQSSVQNSIPKDPEQIHVVYHHPPDYGHRYSYGPYPQQGNGGQGFIRDPPQPVYVTHSYNAYKPSPYVTEYAHPQSQPEYSRYSRPDHYNQVHQSQPVYSHYNRPDNYDQVYQSQPVYSHYGRPDNYSPVYYSGNSSNGNGNGNGNGNITSMFSEENPNACTIV